MQITSSRQWQYYLTFCCIASNSSSNSSCCGPATCCVMVTLLRSGGGTLNKVGNARITWQWDVLDGPCLIYWVQISTCSSSYTWFGMLSRLSVHYHTHGMTCYRGYLPIFVHMVRHDIKINCLSYTWYGMLSRLTVPNHTHGTTCYQD